MSVTTPIEWADATWSPWEGCTQVSPGCDHCYAKGMNTWLRQGANWGPGAPRRIYGEDHWAKPFRWQRDALKFDTLHRRRRRVFPSVCDPFDTEAPGLQRDRLWATIRATPALDWLLLTKRIGNAASMLPADWGAGYPNIWLGATVVNQAEADRDIPKLLAVQARVRFLSIEPMLGPIDLRLPYRDECYCDHESRAFLGAAPASGMASSHTPACPHADRTDWVICGGESGHGARPLNPQWARDLRDQCAAAGVAFLHKQNGEFASVCEVAGPGAHHTFDDGRTVRRVGKKAAGRLLDGRTHDEFPEVF